VEALVIGFIGLVAGVVVVMRVVLAAITTVMEVAVLLTIMAQIKPILLAITLDRAM
jgi:hypothetical protein